MSAVTLQNCLDASSYYLGESGTPSTETTKRTMFANEAKKNIRDLRNWTWELADAPAMNITNATTSYSLSTITDLKDKQSLYTVKITDSNGNVSYYTAVEEPQYDSIVNASQADQVYMVKGNSVDGYTLLINPPPTATVTNGLNIRYYRGEADFVNTTDTTRIPKEEAIAWYIAAKVLFGYREQAQYQLAMNEYQNALSDLAMLDQKVNPFSMDNALSFRQAIGASNDMRSYYGLIPFGLLGLMISFIGGLIR